MFPRTNYEMTQADLDAILDACKPTVVMKIGDYTGSSPQENANRAWAALGAKMGFDHMTVQPIAGKGNCFFTAIPRENETQCAERLAREAEEKRLAEIARLEAVISEAEGKLSELTK